MSEKNDTAEALRQIKAAYDDISGARNYIPGSAWREAFELLDFGVPSLVAVAECALELDLTVFATYDVEAAVACQNLREALEALGQRHDAAGPSDAGEEG